MKLTEIEKKKKEIQHIRFNDKLAFCLSASMNNLNSYYSKKEKYSFDGRKGFLIESIFELIIRSGETVITPQTPIKIENTLNDCCQVLFNSQNMFINELSNDFMILFSLWQFENQEDIFIKFYRYAFFFSFKNSNVDMPKLFVNKFKVDYDRIIEFAIGIYLLATGIDKYNINHFIDAVNKIFVAFPDVVQLLTISREDYLKYSIYLCPDINKIAFSLKISFQFPILQYDGDLYLPLPHVLPTAASKSLLYRLTEGDEILRNKIGKNVMEAYLLKILNNSGIYDFVSPERSFVSKKQNCKTSDVLVFKDNLMIGFESKLTTPSAKMRLLDKDAVKETKKIIVDNIKQIYKSIFEMYPNNFEDLPKISLENRYGIVVTLERFDFDGKTLFDIASEELKLDSKMDNLLRHNIFIRSLYDIEEHCFLKDNLFDKILLSIKAGKTHDFIFDFGKKNKKYLDTDYKKFKDRILKLESIRKILEPAN